MRFLGFTSLHLLNFLLNLLQHRFVISCLSLLDRHDWVRGQLLNRLLAHHEFLLLLLYDPVVDLFRVLKVSPVHVR